MQRVCGNIWSLIEKISYSMMKKLFLLFREELTDETFAHIMEFIKFGIVGVSNTILSYLLNILVLFLLNPLEVTWDYFVANIVAFFLSVLWSFYWNNRFVFTKEEGEKRSIGKTLLKTYIAYSFTGIFLNNILSYIWIEMLGVSKYVAPLINLIISVPLNFIINKLWAFKAEK